MTFTEFILQNNLQPADVLVVNKSVFGMLDHYLVYMGWDEDGYPWFMANMKKGVQCLFIEDIEKLAAQFEINRVRKFEGNSRERANALERARSLERKKYHLLNFNCEHFANYVQHGESRSQQSQIAGGLAAVALLFAGIGLVARAVNRDEDA